MYMISNDTKHISRKRNFETGPTLDFQLLRENVGILWSSGLVDLHHNHVSFAHDYTQSCSI